MRPPLHYKYIIYFVSFTTWYMLHIIYLYKGEEGRGGGGGGLVGEGQLHKHERIRCHFNNSAIFHDRADES